MDESVEYILELLCSCSCNWPNWYLNEILRSGALISITDGSSLGNPETSNAGGMARSANGEWLWGFSLHLGVTNNTIAKLWGIREVLVRAWANGYHQVCLQIDSLLAYKWLTTNEDYPMEFSNLILDCRWLLNRDWEARIEHIWREANSCVDLLAKRGAS